MSSAIDGSRIVGRLRGLLLPARRRTLAVQLVALAAVLSGLSAAAVLVLVKLVQWLGPWWQQSR